MEVAPTDELQNLHFSDENPTSDEDVAGPFEGPEKLLEIWWQDSEASVPNGKGLRRISRNDWEEMLDLVHCKVLSVVQNDAVDAYMLSESSMFVWPHKLILKTCGTTTLLLGLEKILEFAHSVGFTKGAWRTFYSRKTFMFPEKQKGPHKDWNDEMDVLNKFFVGKGYSVGPSNGDHWLLYISDPKDEVLGHVAQVDVSTSYLDRIGFNLLTPRASPPDQSLEILMSELPPETCSKFYASSDHASLDGNAAGQKLSKALGIASLCGGGESNDQLDAYLFQPCGYSANIITQHDRYATIHVTPEMESSYASFETNISFGGGSFADRRLSVEDVVRRVLDVFKPGRWSVTLFVSREEDEPETTGEKGYASFMKRQMEGYRRTDKISYEFEDYDLLFSSFARR